jgi:hypothetical protein
MLGVLADGGTFVEPGGLGGVVSAAGVGGNGNGLTKSERAKLKAAEKALRHGVIAYTTRGLWAGNFSKVAKRIEMIARFIDDIPAAADAVSKLECAAYLLEHNPDVRSVTPDFPGRRGRTARIAADFSAVVPVLNLGRRNKPIAPEDFTPCMQPSVVGVSVRGRGEAVAGPGLALTYTATGRGTARLATTVEYAPEMVTVIMEENGGLPPLINGGVAGGVAMAPVPGPGPGPGPIIIHVPAELVAGDGVGLGMEFSFRKKGCFCLRQR